MQILYYYFILYDFKSKFYLVLNLMQKHFDLLNYALSVVYISLSIDWSFRFVNLKMTDYYQYKLVFLKKNCILPKNILANRHIIYNDKTLRL